MTTLFTPPDVEAAWEAWKANCGPSATAALLGLPLAGVRHAFPWFPARPWCSPTQLREALAMLGHIPRWATYGVEARGSALEQFDRMPREGLVTVQLDGPWCDLADKRPAYRYTHTVAARRIVVGSTPLVMVYDVNAGTEEAPGGWLFAAVWEHAIMSLLVSDKKRATGWFVRTVLAVG